MSFILTPILNNHKSFFAPLQVLSCIIHFNCEKDVYTIKMDNLASLLLFPLWGMGNVSLLLLPTSVLYPVILK
jgi:hypothetical protein